MRPVQPGYATTATVRTGLFLRDGDVILTPLPDSTARMEWAARDPKAEVPASLNLTDRQRRELIEALGGYPDPPEAHVVMRQNAIDGLYLFENWDQAEKFSELFPGADLETRHHARA